jgi:hypothetical protein
MQSKDEATSGKLDSSSGEFKSGVKISGLKLSIQSGEGLAIGGSRAIGGENLGLEGGREADCLGGDGKGDEGGVGEGGGLTGGGGDGDKVGTLGGGGDTGEAKLGVGAGGEKGDCSSSISTSGTLE